MNRSTCVRTVPLVALLAVSVAVSTPAQEVSRRPALPLEPITAVLDAFQTHNVVALSEPHRNEQAHAFRLALIRDPRFARVVDDVVWECGNARYQSVMDRFVRGETVSDTEIRQVWRNTIGSPGIGCDFPIYEGFLRAVRSVNLTLPAEQQLRVLLGDPPVDWDELRTLEDSIKWAELRDVHAIDVIRREVLAKNRRALVIYGSAHLARKSLRSNYERDDLGPIVDRLSDDPAARIFSIWADYTIDLSTIQGDVMSWPAPSLAIVRETVLGAADFLTYWGTTGAGTARFTIRNGARRDIPKDEWKSRRMEEQFDAVLYLGPPSAMTNAKLSPALCADHAYMEMRVKRMALVGQPTHELQQYCASVSPR